MKTLLTKLKLRKKKKKKNTKAKSFEKTAKSLKTALFSQKSAKAKFLQKTLLK